MKRLYAFILAITLLFSLCACGQSSAEQPTESSTIQPTETIASTPGELQVGYARVDITPRITTPLRGFGNTSSRMSNMILEPLFASCVAITGENGQTVLIIAIDILTSEFTGKILPAISERTGVPVENIFINASHTHAATDVLNGAKAYYIPYMKELQELFSDVAVMALLDRAPSQMTYGSIETENMTFTRHYQYMSTSGKVSYSFGSVDAVSNSGISEHITEPDETMHVIRFTREDDKDVVMVNWRAHPLLHSGEARLQLSADFISGFRTAVELTEDVHFIYLQGAAGNMNSITAIPSEIRTEDNHEYGSIMADYLFACLANNMQEAEGSEIKVTGSDAVINKLNAFSVGDSVAFVTAPNELFDTTSVYMEENSPYPMNFTLGYTNGGKGYVPTASLYDYDYEWYEVRVTPYPRGTAEKVQEEFVTMLQQLSKAEAEQNTASELTLSHVESKQVSAELYWNVYRWDYTPGGTLDHSSRLAEEDGYYHVVFAVNGEQKTLLVKDKSLIEIIDYNDITGLVLDADGIVTDVKVLRDCTNGLAANRSIVIGVDGNTISCVTGAVGGTAFTLNVTNTTAIFDVSNTDESCGQATDLREGDQILAVEDLEGVISHIYVIRRAHVDDLTHEDHCVCGGAAEGLHGECAAVTEWIAWGDDPDEWDVLPAKSGHYYLTRDVVLSKRHKSMAGEDITICLNGKEISATQSRLISVLGTLSICDCRYTCEDGVYTYEGTVLLEYSEDETVGGAFYLQQGGTLNLYGGNILGVGTWKRGGLIYTTTDSTTNLYNAVLSGTAVMHEGGGIYISNGDVNIYGGVITGCRASVQGSAIYMKSGTLTISGAPKITGNKRTDLSVAEGGKIVIGEGGLKPGAEIGISMDSGTGIFATNATKEDAKYFTATKGGKITWNSETNQLSIEAAG